MTTKRAILKGIRAKCIDCCCGQVPEVTKCTAYTCELWSYRMAKDPNPAKSRGFAKRTATREEMKVAGQSGPLFGHAALTGALHMFIIEEIDPKTRKVVETIATATNAIVGKAAFEMACEYYKTGYLVYRIKARVISERKPAVLEN